MLIMLNGRKTPYEAVFMCNYKDYLLVRVDEPNSEYTNQDEPEEGWCNIYVVDGDGDIVGDISTDDEMLNDGTWNIKYNIKVPKIDNSNNSSHASVVTYSWIEE